MLCNCFSNLNFTVFSSYHGGCCKTGGLLDELWSQHHSYHKFLQAVACVHLFCVDRQLWKHCAVHSTPVTPTAIFNLMMCATWRMDSKTINTQAAGLLNFTDSLRARTDCCIQPTTLLWTYHTTSSPRTCVRRPASCVRPSLAGARHSSISDINRLQFHVQLQFPVSWSASCHVGYCLCVDCVIRRYFTASCASIKLHTESPYFVQNFQHADARLKKI